MNNRLLQTRIFTWLVRFNLAELRNAYDAARDRSDRDRRQLEDAWSKAVAEEEAGVRVLVQVDEDGQVVYDYGEQIGEMGLQNDAVLELIRQAFTIALHGLWERGMVWAMRGKSYSQEAAFKHLVERGFNPDEHMINALRLVANVAKHGAGSSAKELWTIAPRYYDEELSKEAHPKPDYDNLHITDAHVEEFFAAVKDAWTLPPD